MARNKATTRKKRLAKQGRKNKAIPTWIVMKTKGTVRRSPFTERHWRTSRLKP